MERGRVSLTGYDTWSKMRQLTQKFQMVPTQGEI